MAERECINSGLPLVSIITINYNQAETTIQFIESCKLLTYRNYEIIVVDNASEPAFTDFHNVQQYPYLRIIRSSINLGFTGGNNLGMKEAKGIFFFIVNNDTELSPTIIENLLRPFSLDGRIGVTCPKIRYFSNPNIIQYAGYSSMNMYTGTAVPIGYNQVDNENFNKSYITHFAHGCAMMLPRKVVEQVGGFAERFFLYYEELDWSQRIKNAGYLIYYEASAQILHKESVSVGQSNPLKTYYITRNRILFVRRHSSWYQRLIFYTFFTICVTPKHLFMYVIRGKFFHARAFIKAILWNLTSPSTSTM